MPEIRPAREFLEEPPTPEVRGPSPISQLIVDQLIPRVQALPPSAPAPPPGPSPMSQLVIDQLVPRPQVAPTPIAPPEPAGPPSFLGEFTSGLEAGFKRFVPLAAGVAGVTSDVFGFDEVAQDMLEFAQQREEEIFRDLPPTITFDQAFASPGNFARFALRNLGEQVPIIASIILGGGVGGLIGRLVGRGALTAAEGTAGLSRFGVAAGGVATATGIETGATSIELFGATQEVQPVASFTAGVAKGALEAIVPLALARRLGITQGATQGIIGRAVAFLDKVPTRPRRIAAGFGAVGIAEGVTEFLQEAVDVATRSFVDENFDVLSPEVRSRLLGSATVGVIVGAVLGGLGGAVGGRPAGKETPITERLPGAEEAPGAVPPPPVTPPTLPEGPPQGPPGFPPPAGPVAPPPAAVPLTPAAPPPAAEVVPPTPAAPPITVVPSVLEIEESTVTKFRNVAALFVQDLDSPFVISAEDVDNFVTQNEATVQLQVGLLNTDKIAIARMLSYLHTVVQPETRRGIIASLSEAGFSLVGVDVPRLGAPVTREEVRRAARTAAIPTISPAEFIDIAEEVAPVAVLFEAGGGVQRLEALIEKRPNLEFRPDLSQRNKREIVKLFREITTLGTDRFGERSGLIQDIIQLGLIVRLPDVKLQTMFAFDPSDRTDETFDETIAFGINKGPGERDYNIDKHPLGTAQIVSSPGSYAALTARGKLNTRKARDAITSMMKLFGMKDEKLLIAVNSFNRGPDDTRFVSEGANASANLSTPNRSYILINRALLESKNDLELATVVIHEFGHILTWRAFVRTDPATQLKIINAFNQQTRKAAFGSFVDFESALRAPGRFDAFLSIGDPNAPTLTSISLRQEPQYWFNFSEFLAEQVSKWFQTSAKPLTRIEKFFKGLSQDLKRLYEAVLERFGISKDQLRPQQDIEAWIDSLVGGIAAGAPEALHANVENSLAKSAIENSKEFEEDSSPAGEMGENIERMAKISGVPLKQRKRVRAGVDRINWLTKWGISLRQLTQLNPQIVGLRTYNELMDAWSSASTQWKARANETLRVWRRDLSPQSQNALAKFIFDVDAMTYLKKDEDARQPTEAELLELAKKHQLTEEAFGVFQQVRKDLTDFLNAIQDVLVADIRATVQNPLIQEVKIAQMEQEFNRLRQRPYFPHSRFGDFSVIVKDSDGRTVHTEQFATKAEARGALKSAIASFRPDEGFIARIDKIPEEARPFRGLPPALLQQLKTMPGLTEQQKIWIEQLLVELSPAQSFRKRLARRKDIPGFSLDAMRSYANYFWHGSNYLARIQFQRPLQETINAVNAEASDPAFALAQPGQDVSQRRRIADFMQQHFDQIMNPASDWAQIRSIAFIWWLGFAPQSAVLNLTQVPMVAWPYLASRYGNVKSVNALRKALGAVPRMMRGKTQNVSDSFLRALTRGVEQNVLDESYATELAATSEGPNLSGLLPGTKPQRMMMNIAHWSAFMFQTSEKFNRRATFTAAWELAISDINNPILQEMREFNNLEHQELIKQGFSEDEALAYIAARDAVWATQFQYSNHARARFMRGRKGVVFTFFTFVQNMVFFAAHDRGRIQFFLMMFVLAGMMGLPFADDLNAVVRFASRKLLGKDFDIERATREFVVDIMGEDSISPDLILHGISRVGFGIPAAADLMGIPFPKFDLSASVSMGRIIPGLEEFSAPSRSFDATFSRVATSAAGAAFGIGINAFKFLADDQLEWNDPKRWERAMPRAMKNLSKGIRFLEEGRERTRTGATVLEFDASDPDQLAEIVGQSLGFTPTRMSRFWDRKRMEQEAIAFWAIRRGMLLRQWDQAIVSKDRKIIATQLAAIKRYNNEVATPLGLRITSRQLRQSQRERARQRRLFEAGLPTSKREIGLTREIQRLHPETIEDVEDAPR